MLKTACFVLLAGMAASPGWAQERPVHPDPFRVLPKVNFSRVTSR